MPCKGRDVLGFTVSSLQGASCKEMASATYTAPGGQSAEISHVQHTTAARKIAGGAEDRAFEAVLHLHGPHVISSKEEFDADEQIKHSLVHVG